jgi:predicted nucleic acid-binding protein
VAAIVLDASVCLKWFLPDEGDRAQALALREAIVQGEVQPVAPSHLPLEIAAGLTQAVRRGRSIESDILPALAAFDQMEFDLREVAGLTARATSIALPLGVTPYDAAYVAAAEQNDAPLITADDPLQRAASAAGHNVILLRDLPAD